MDRQEWLAERRTGLGGSDVASLFNVGYGCTRRLAYDKRGTVPDYPREETTIMRLGTFLESFFADRYSEETGRTLTPTVSKAHEAYPELRVNADRLITGDKQPFDSLDKYGVLEIKSMGRAVYYKTRREGLPVDYILQVQMGILVHGASWGAFCLGNRDSGEIISFDVERDNDICREITIAGPKFWATVENGPMPEALEPDDKRCQRCEYRKTCQGNALIQISNGEMPQAEELRPLLDEFLERKELFAQAEELLDESGEELRTRLADRQQVMVGEHKVYFRPQAGRVTYQGKELAEAVRSFIGHIVVELSNGTLTLDDVVKTAPKPEAFTKQGLPFKTLRVY